MLKNETLKAEISFSLSAQPALVLGPTQRDLHVVIERAQQRGVGCLVRDTGGTAVLDGPWLLTTKVVVPKELANSVLAREKIISLFGAMHVAALQSMNVNARLATEAVSAPPEHAWSCFAGVSRNEVITATRKKIVGTSFRHGITHSYLVSGVLISPVDWPLLCELFGQASAAADWMYGNTSFADCTPDQMMQSLTQQFDSQFSA